LPEALSGRIKIWKKLEPNQNRLLGARWASGKLGRWKRKGPSSVETTVSLKLNAMLLKLVSVVTDASKLVKLRKKEVGEKASVSVRFVALR
jgi:hypothetical protein